MRVMNNIRLTDNQGRVLARIIASPTPQVAADEISNNQNMVAARNELMSLNLITMANGAAEVTDKGMTVATQENIVDEMGELSEKGQELAYTDVNGQPEEDTTGAQPDMGMDAFATPGFEGVEPPRVGPFLKEIYALAIKKR